jgi:hypothetical protein
MPTPKPLFAIYDGYHAVRFRGAEAWMLWDDGAWHEMNPADAQHKAALLTEHAYRRVFGPVPPLPDTAFRSR